MRSIIDGILTAWKLALIVVALFVVGAVIYFGPFALAALFIYGHPIIGLSLIAVAITIFGAIFKP